MSLGIHRAVFLDALASLVDPSILHFNKRCVSMHALEGHKLQIVFADGSIAQADVVLGADGIRSIVRTHVLKDGMELQEEILEPVRVAFTNTSVYRGLVSLELEELQKAQPQTALDRLLCFSGSGKVKLIQ